MIDASYFAIGKPVRVMGFVGIVIAIEPIGSALFVTVESAKRIILHQTSYDRLDFNLLPWVWQPATALDLLQDAFEQCRLYPEMAVETVTERLTNYREW